ncbi:MAG: TetR family transcriptional regulator [Pseudoclavibacter sp.]
MTPRGPAGETSHEKLSRTEIVTTALEVLDGHGLPNLSMRRISDYLQVQPSALYWHFPNKQSLLAAVSDRILQPLTAETWLQVSDGQTRALATQLRTALLSRRDGAELVSSSFALDLLSVDLTKLISGAARSDFTLDAVGSRSCAEAVVHYTIGQAFHEQQRAHATEVGALHPRTADSRTTDLPAQLDPTISFTSGLDLIIAGARQLASEGAS